MKLYSCVCGNTLFFENTQCLACGREVAWCPHCRGIRALEPALEGRYRCADPACGSQLVKCVNNAREGVCNRAIAAEAAAGQLNPLCDCCRFNAIIPDLSVPGNRQRWARLAAAKRRVFHTLDTLGLPYGSAADSFDPPLSFDFKGDAIAPAALWHTMGETERVYTGHANGKITINIREADDAKREKLRVDLGEAHRTVIGHFRHEMGHYFWDALIRGRQEGAFSDVFGDHNQPPYDEALESHYREGPPGGWQARFISAYATMHPWEDWAETFAFYLDMAGVLETAAGLKLIPPVDWGDLEAMLGRFRDVGLLVTEINRTMGLKDLVPEVVTPAVEHKLHFVHRIVRGAAAAGS
jgi:hypothetical protein